MKWFIVGLVLVLLAIVSASAFLFLQNSDDNLDNNVTSNISVNNISSIINTSNMSSNSSKY